MMRAYFCGLGQGLVFFVPPVRRPPQLFIYPNQLSELSYVLIIIQTILIPFSFVYTQLKQILTLQEH